jgi:bifunctional enzyme CysN/CysC
MARPTTPRSTRTTPRAASQGASPRQAPTQAGPPATLDALFAAQARQDLLRFITCGSVDDGKSTLIGRLLWEASQLADDHVASLRADSIRHGTRGGEIDFALLVDGLAAEREQGITIDVAYRFFETPRRKFIVADTPGHVQYTRNMVTGASTADAAVILVDATQGLLIQTRRHAFLASLVGLRHVVVAVNKLDAVAYDAAVFHRIVADFEQFTAPLGFESVTAIPVSAIHGDNVVERSPNTSWYRGPTLLGWLETVDVRPAPDARFVLPVQWVNRPNASFRGFSGTVASGSIRVGDAIRVTASGQLASVAEVLGPRGPQPEAARGEAITLRLDREVDVSRGDVLTRDVAPVEQSDQFEAELVWLHPTPGLIGRSYAIKLGTQWAAASLTTIKHRVDPQTLGHEAARQLELNDIARCTLATSKPLAFDAYTASRALGAFILVDRLTHATVGAGFIRHSLRRAQNVHRQDLAVTRAHREALNGHEARVLWFTGLSGSGKSTIANALEQDLHAKGVRTYILDGDNLRQGLNRDLGFTEADRVENIRRVAEVAKLMMDAGLLVMTAFISPFRADREMARELIGADRFLEVHVSTPLEVCEQRDVKGLYRKARSGALPNFTGVGSPYEPPASPDVVIDAGACSLDEAVARLRRALEASPPEGRPR